MIELTMPCDSCNEPITRDQAHGYGEDFLCSWCFVPATSPEDLEHAAALDSHSVRKETPTMYILNPQWHVFRDNPLGCAIAIHTDVIHPKIIGDADSIKAEPCGSISRFGPGSLTLSLSHIDDLHFDVHHVWTLYDAGYLNNDAVLIFKGGEEHHVDRYPCDVCGVLVRGDEYLGYDKPDGETEYKCENCFDAKYRGLSEEERQWFPDDEGGQ